MSSGIRNPHATYGYRDEGWDEDSLWTFRKEQTSDDRDAVQLMISKTIVGHIDRKHVRKLMKEGGSIEDYVESVTDTKTLMTTEKAMLARMAVRVEGAFFTVPEGYKDEHGKLSPYAGKLIPQPPRASLEKENKETYDAEMAAHLEWLGLIDPEERSQALSFMSAVWAGRDPEDLKRFPGDSFGVAEPVGRKGKSHSGGDGVPA
jgi:hypothetical protein